MLALFISSVAYFLQVTNAELSFQNIMKCYRTQPQAVSHVSPLLTSCKLTSACLFYKTSFQTFPLRFTEVFFLEEGGGLHLEAVVVMVEREVR